MAELGSAANYKANRGSSGPQATARGRSAPRRAARLRWAGKAPDGAHGGSQRVL